MEDPPDPAGDSQKDTAGIKDKESASITQQHLSDDEQPEQCTVAPTEEFSQGQLDESNEEKSSTLPSDLTKDGQTEDEKEPKDSVPPIEGDTNLDHKDGAKESPQKDCLLPNNEKCDDQQESVIPNPEEEEATQVLQEDSMEERGDDLRPKVETVGPTNQETHHLDRGRRIQFVIISVVLVLVATLVQRHLETPPPNTGLPIEIFLSQLKTVEARFPHQRPELWSRSRIHLKRHLATARPSEPVSLILTAGIGSSGTLRCLAHDLGAAFSAAMNGSVLQIDGAGRAGEDSDQVKLDIDGQLQGAFEGDKPVAVIHHFEQLPPGSTLIFYRYCDHENAAYKKTFLIFTVLLEEEAIPAEISLNAVEEMVDDYLQRKFLSHGRPLAYDRMDLDKYGGLWSRISHLILPVAAEASTEHKGCS
ncbi:torsin-1A-interacting protein 2-like [Corythoichthys intestinalis]|uniref:torsin-1A-interacting protein 2-like n=1 Tax=Corythoichthys intestinalis TaxID=161448 RepID=UPI0025A5A755|nr:torsin-1A-interacting protein 2-like [Corythoichthys intestinalis]XP_057698036.1 torsin-1A-interacting protein 2-like [Corythoichthys intestinalis]